MNVEKSDEREAQLWAAYNKVKNNSHESQSFIDARNDLILYHYDILEGISKRLSRTLKDITQPEIESYGLDGLIDAIDSFDPLMGAKFKTWASIRIRGSVIDNIRKNDWVPRLVRQRHSKIEEARNKIISAMGEEDEKQLAKELGVSLKELRELDRKSTPIAQMSMNAKPRGHDSDDYNELSEMFIQKDEPHPADNMLREEMYKKLLGKHFTRPERKIMYLHYYENLTMKEIADQTGFSESRISQMHADILRRLKKKVECNPEYAADLQRMFE